MRSTQLAIVPAPDFRREQLPIRSNLLRDFCEHYIATNPCLKSEESKRLLRTSCDRWDEFIGRPAMLYDFTDEAIVNFIAYRERLGMMSSTVEREVSKLATLWRRAAAMNLVHQPTFRICKVTPGVPNALTKGEIRNLLHAAQEAPGRSWRDVPDSLYYAALFAVLWDTQARIGETREVTRGDISFIGRWWIHGAWVTFRIRKGGAAPVRKRVRGWTARKMRALLDAHRHDKLFGDVNRTTIYGPARHIYKAAGLSRKGDVFHVLRRSGASELDRIGENAQKALGHADAKTTKDYYIDPNISQPPQSVDKLFAPVALTDRIIGAVKSRFAS